MKGISDRYDDSGVPNRAIYPSSKTAWYISLLVITKFCRVIGLYLSYDVLKFIHVVHFLFIIKTISGLAFVLLQKPISSGKRITKEQWWWIFRHAIFSNLISLVWLFGISLCGPLRSVLLFEHSSCVITTAALAVFSGAGGPPKIRGAVFFLVAILGLLLFDNDDQHLIINDHPEGQQHHGLSHLFYYIISRTGVADHKGGVILLVVSMCLNVGFQSASRKLSVQVGGAKRLHALSSVVSAITLVPLVFILHVTYEPIGVPWMSLLVPVGLIALCAFVIDYYVDGICVQRLEANYSARYSTLALISGALIMSLLWNHPFLIQLTNENKLPVVLSEEHVPSGGVIFSSIMFLCAVFTLSAPHKLGSKGKFVGYSAAGLPLYTFAADAGQKSSTIFYTLRNGLKQVLDEPDSRRIFYFLCLNLVFTFVELVYGIWTNCLGLISDGFHMLFDCSALVLGLHAALMTRWKSTPTFSFGFGRVEVLSGFMNGLFLVVIAFSVFTEALKRLFDPPEIRTERLLTVSVVGLLVNLTGIFAFHHSHARNDGACHSHGASGHHQHSHHHQPSKAVGHGHSHLHSNANMQGVFLHVLADTLGSVGVIVSSILIENFGWLIADPICSMFIASLIFLSVLPLLKESSLVLLLRIPPHLEKEISELLNKILTIDGVVSYRNQHFWQHSSSVLAGTIHVQVHEDVSEQKIISQISNLFRDQNYTYVTVQIEKESYFHYLSGLNSNSAAMSANARSINMLNFNDIKTSVKAI